MNKDRLGALAIVLVGVAALGTLLIFFEQPVACPCNSDSNPWYPCLHNPCPLMVTFTLDSYHFNTSTNLTLNIRNTGASSISLAAYYVKDSTGAQYANSNWQGPTLPPSAAISINILIDGTAFTFVRGSSYTVTMVTSRNSQYSFSVID
jgi:hypothetical protein